MVSPIKFRLFPNRLVLPLDIKGISDQFVHQVALEHKFILGLGNTTAFPDYIRTQPQGDLPIFGNLPGVSVHPARDAL